MSDISPQVLAQLTKLNLSYEVIQCDPELADTFEFCNHYGYKLEECGNTILAASKRGVKKYACCLVRGSDKVNINKTVRNLLEVSKISFATKDESEQVTGMTSGGITLVGLPESIPIFVDKKVLQMEKIILGSGNRNSKILLDTKDLQLIPNTQFIENLSM